MTEKEAIDFLRDRKTLSYIINLISKIESLKEDFQLLNDEKTRMNFLMHDLENTLQKELKKLNRFCWFASALAIIYTIKLFIGG